VGIDIWKTSAARHRPGCDLTSRKERDFFLELVTSDRELKASSEGSKMKDLRDLKDKVFLKLFGRSQLPQKSADLSLTITKIS